MLTVSLESPAINLSVDFLYLVWGKGEWEKEVMLQTVVSLFQRRTSELRSFPSSIDEAELGNVCNEELFKYLLASEHMRSDRSGSSFQMLLVMLVSSEGEALARIDGTVAASLFSALKHCLRGTDYTGWYQDQFVIGAVLTAMRGCEVEEVSKQVEKRFLEASRARLSENECGQLRVRVCQQSEVEAGKILLEG